MNAELLRRAERAHYFLQSVLFLRDRRDLSGASLFSAGRVTDPEWNHAGLVDLDPALLPQTLELAREYYHARGLRAAIVAGPFSQPADLARRLPGHGFATKFRHVWHFLGSGPIPPARLDAGIEIRQVSGADEMRDFVNVFESVYSVDLETGEETEPPEGYREALEDSFRNDFPGVDVVHYLATAEGEPAGVATSIHCREGAFQGFSGLYNLAVRREFRRRGLGGALVRQRAVDAERRGQDVVFLQTERESVERRLGRHGFVKRMTTLGFVEEES